MNCVSDGEFDFNPHGSETVMKNLGKGLGRVVLDEEWVVKVLDRKNRAKKVKKKPKLRRKKCNTSSLKFLKVIFVSILVSYI